jgi:predicted phage terminase large subunit-like protein
MKQAKRRTITPVEAVRPADAAVLDAIARRDFTTFIRLCFRSLSPGAQFKPNWHIEALAYHLEQVRLGKIKRLIINMPPRSLKSIVTSVAFPAYVLGHHPTKRLICVSYGSDLATKHANDCRSVMKAGWFRGMFAATVISSRKDTEGEFVTTQNGFRLTTSLDGTLTGRGGDLIIIDDPLRPIDALSEAKREKVNQWYFNTLLSRLDDKVHGAIIIVMQRLHLNDLTGVLLQSGEEWTVLTLQAIAEEDEKIQIGDDRFHCRQADELLHPAHEPKEVLDSLKNQLGSYDYAAQYQQRPIPRGGGLIKREWVRRYKVQPDKKWPARVILSLDTASKDGCENDWSVCTAWLLHEHKNYLFDVMRLRVDYPTLKERMIAFAKVHNPTKILIEDCGVGTALIAELKKAVRRPVKAVKPERDKLTRMSIESAKFEAGQVYLPESAPWLADLEAELFSFPQSRYDDQVDSISQALAGGEAGYDTTGRWVGQVTDCVPGFGIWRR